MDDIRNFLAPNGILRAGINLGNFLLVSGTDDKGIPKGVSPDLAKSIASELEVECKLITFDRPGDLADSVNDNVWDIANIAYEHERAESIDFSNPYVLIDANFLVRKNSNLLTNKDIDQKEITIAVAERSAYDLWLKENFVNSKIVRASSIPESHKLFNEGKVDVLAGLKPKLLDELSLEKEYFMIEKPFTYVKQSVGIKKGKMEVINFLNSFISLYISNGFLKKSLKLHKVEKKLSIPL